MAFRWNEYLDLAQYLKRHEASLTVSPEASSRCATGRAYYAAFRHALNYAKFHQGYKPFGTGKDHAGLITHFNSKGMGQIAITLDQLRQWRNQCDYDDTVHHCGPMRDHAMISADYVIKLLP